MGAFVGQEQTTAWSWQHICHSSRLGHLPFLERRHDAPRESNPCIPGVQAHAATYVEVTEWKHPGAYRLSRHARRPFALTFYLPVNKIIKIHRVGPSSVHTSRCSGVLLAALLRLHQHAFEPDRQVASRATRNLRTSF